MTGARPPPCESFSLTMVDDHRAVLFGGYVAGHGASSELYILDLKRMVSCLCTIIAHSNAGSTKDLGA